MLESVWPGVRLGLASSVERPVVAGSLTKAEDHGQWSVGSRTVVPNRDESSSEGAFLAARVSPTYCRATRQPVHGEQPPGFALCGPQASPLSAIEGPPGIPSVGPDEQPTGDYRGFSLRMPIWPTSIGTNPSFNAGESALRR